MLSRSNACYAIDQQKKRDREQAVTGSRTAPVHFSGSGGTKIRVVMTLCGASAAFLVGMGFAASSHAAVAAPVPAATRIPGPNVASFTPAIVIGVALLGAAARRRRTIRAGAVRP
jgi:hypothetical protein